MKLKQLSIDRLASCHPDLQRVIYRAAEISSIEFIVTEGLRSLDRQKILVSKGASKTLKSRHLTGHAVDLACLIDGNVCWDWPMYINLAKDVKEAAKIEGVPIEWGGDWVTFKDGPHYQLPWSKYPLED